jgi:hypothetical protein
VTDDYAAPGEVDVGQDGTLQEDDGYITWLRERYDDADSYSTSASNDQSDFSIGGSRQKALDYYMRRPMGDERPGRSSVVSGDVYKVVEGVSTAIADIFCSNDDAVQFAGRSEDDAAKAEQRTEVVNYLFWTQCKGYLPLIEAIKDGVLLKTGYLTWYWETEKLLKRERYKSLNQDAINQLQADGAPIKDLRITGQGVGDDGLPTFDVEVDLVKESGRLVVESIAPEHVKISPTSKSADLEQAPQFFTVSYKTEAECLMCGYSQEQIEKMEWGSGKWSESDGVYRDANIGGEDQARIITAYVKVDRDGDGVVELRKTIFSGDALLADEVIDEVNVAAWTPNIQPHEFFGRCPADDAIQSQELNSTLWRQGLDSLYHSTTPMWRVDKNDSRVNIEDFYAPEIGRPVRADQGAAEPIVMPYVGQHVFPMLEYSTADTENLTGFTRYNQGLDAKSLNKTLGGMQMITNMSQQRVRMMARNFGEMCFSRVMRGIAKLISQHGEKALSVRIRGQYVEVDPREWTEEFDMMVNVGLGTVDKDQQAMHLGQVSMNQQAAVAAGGLGKVVTVKNLYNVQRKIAALAGFKDPTFAWTDPESVPEPPPPGPPPEVQKQQMILQADQQKFQAQTGIDQQKQSVEMQDKAAARQHDAELQMALATLKEEAETNRVLLVENMRLQSQQAMQGKADELEAQGKNTEQSAVQLADMAPVIGEAISMLAQSVQAMQQALQVLTLPKVGKTMRNKDGSFSVVVEPVMQ